MQPVKLQRLLHETATHLQAGRLEAAARLCAQARTQAPRDAGVLGLSGLVALQQEKFADAAKYLEQLRR